ncbi:hypothetical protein GCM10007382_03650 [Salinibacterium xinjiangense]|nr:hypothetical protein GCM10007382_03650 [Salinibacterium xinjiangense]
MTGLLDECGALTGSGVFMAKVIASTNRASDTVGAAGDNTRAQRNADGSVAPPPGFVDAYRRYVDHGWGFIPFPEQSGGGFPHTVGLATQEMMPSVLMTFSLGSLLTQGAIDALLHYGSDKQKTRSLPKMITGEWTGTMNLMGPQAGSDVDALTRRAVATRALATDAESVGQRNAVSALSVEHRLAFRGSPTCMMAQDNVTGDLIGEENEGMRIRFHRMDITRLSVGMQELAIAATGTGSAALARALFAPSDNERAR